MNPENAPITPVMPVEAVVYDFSQFATPEELAHLEAARGSEIEVTGPVKPEIAEFEAPENVLALLALGNALLSMVYSDEAETRDAAFTALGAVHQSYEAENAVLAHHRLLVDEMVRDLSEEADKDAKKKKNAPIGASA